MEILQRKPVQIALAFIAGFAIGLFIFGWWLTPVKWVDGGPQHLREDFRRSYLNSVADSFALTGNVADANAAFSGWDEAAVGVCNLADVTVDPVQQDELRRLATALNNGSGCPNTTDPVEEEGSGFNPILCILGIILLAILGGIFYLYNRQHSGVSSSSSFGPKDTGGADLPDKQLMADSGGDNVATTPIARFRTAYKRGHDSYDDSFSIENAQGDFLGECGVGISESIGMDSPKNVTAFEVWLFDKNDIRTETKVIMSEHAFNDEAIRAKLATKGDPVLAAPGETIVLETATLIINAEVTEMDYGAGALPDGSHFENFTVELSAWAKDGDHDEPDIQGHIDTMLDF